MLQISQVSNMMVDKLICTQVCTLNTQGTNALKRYCENKYPISLQNIIITRSAIKYILLFVWDFNIQLFFLLNHSLFKQDVLAKN